MGTSVSKNADTRKSGSTGIVVTESEDDDAGGGIGGFNPRHSHRSFSTSPSPGEGRAVASSASPSVAVSYKPTHQRTQSVFVSSRRSSPTPSDPLDDAIVDSVGRGRQLGAHVFSGSPLPVSDSSDAPDFAKALDQYVGRGRAAPTTSTSPVRGSLVAAQGSARDTLIAQAHNDVQPVEIPERVKASKKSDASSNGPVVASAGSAVSLTTSSASSAESILTPEHAEFDLDVTRIRRSPPPQDISGSSPNSATPSSGSTGSDSPKRLSVAWLNNVIRRICVSGLQAKRPTQFVLSPEEIKEISIAAAQLILSEPVHLELATPVKIVGDLHGQFKDLMRIFRKCGMPPSQSYLFLGDYVDRGKQSLETLMLLLVLKLRYPGSVFLLRGNHESASVTKVYGFYDECKRRSSVKVWRHLVDVFNTLPIAATVGGKIFCVHGGLSPYLTSLQDIEKVQRPTDVPDAGLVSDLLWSDPDARVAEWADNDRGVSFLFGKRVLDRFCHDFGFDLVARGHMVVEDGYEFFGKRKLVTIFSAPNYCGDFDNWGAVMSVGEDLICSFELIEPVAKSNTNTNKNRVANS